MPECVATCCYECCCSFGDEGGDGAEGEEVSVGGWSGVWMVGGEDLAGLFEVGGGVAEVGCLVCIFWDEWMEK